MMEIVILVEEVLQMSINNEELRNLRTIGDVKQFIECKVRGLPLPKPTKFLPIEQIAGIMPIQPPFSVSERSLGQFTWSERQVQDQWAGVLLQGHFKDNPVMPASIMLEAVGQLAVLFLLEGVINEPGKMVNPRTIFFTSCEGVRCHRICRPGELLSISVKPKRLKMPLATFEGAIRVGQEKAAMVEEITLTLVWKTSSLRSRRSWRWLTTSRRLRLPRSAPEWCRLARYFTLEPAAARKCCFLGAIPQGCMDYLVSWRIRLALAAVCGLIPRIRA